MINTLLLLRMLLALMLASLVKLARLKCGPENPSMKTILCNSNKFIKSQQIVMSEKNGPAYTMVAIKIETKNALHSLYRGGFWDKNVIIPIGQLLPL